MFCGAKKDFSLAAMNTLTILMITYSIMMGRDAGAEDEEVKLNNEADKFTLEANRGLEKE